MIFTCIVCQKRLSVSYDDNPEKGDLLMRPWYQDENSLNHHAVLCLNCLAVHDTSGSAMRFIFQKILDRPLRVHCAIKAINNGKMVELKYEDKKKNLISDADQADSIINSFPLDILKIVNDQIKKETSSENKRITSLFSDIKPDNWITFYLFYLNQGAGSDACFKRGQYVVHFFIGELLNTEQSDQIINALKPKNDLAVGEFTMILTKIVAENVDQRLKSASGAVLTLDTANGYADSQICKNSEEMQVLIQKLKNVGAIQVH